MQSRKLNFLTSVLRFREVLGGIDILRSLYSVAQKDWDNAKNANDSTHLIQGVQHSSMKTDLIRGYVSKLVKLYMESYGAQPSCWTKHTLASEDTLTRAVIDRICTLDITSNDQLFALVTTRGLGIDASIVAAAVAGEDFVAKATHVINYLGWVTDEADEPASVYFEMIALTAMLNKHGLLNDVLFDRLVEAALLHYTENPDCDLDPIDRMDSMLDEVTIGFPEYDAARDDALALIQARFKG